MKIVLNSIFALLILIITLPSCTKKEPVKPPTVDTGKVNFEFFNEVGGSGLKLNDQWYVNEHGDSFKVTKFNYYISGIQLRDAAGNVKYTETDGYHLIEHSSVPAQMSFELSGVPAGQYSSVSFVIGVDSLHNVSGAQTGDLDPSKGNFWSWNTGYIMLKFEGNSPQAPTADGRLLFHCGGFSGTKNVLKTVALNFPNAIEVKAASTPHVHLVAEVLTMFKAPNIIDFSTITTIHMPGDAANKIADNYATMFSISYSGL